MIRCESHILIIWNVKFRWRSHLLIFDSNDRVIWGDFSMIDIECFFLSISRFNDWNESDWMIHRCCKTKDVQESLDGIRNHWTFFFFLKRTNKHTQILFHSLKQFSCSVSFPLMKTNKVKRFSHGSIFASLCRSRFVMRASKDWNESTYAFFTIKNILIRFVSPIRSDMIGWITWRWFISLNFHR